MRVNVIRNGAADCTNETRPTATVRPVARHRSIKMGKSLREFAAALGRWWVLIIFSVTSAGLGLLQQLVDSGVLGTVVEGPIIVPASAWWIASYFALAIGAFAAFDRIASALREVREQEVDPEFEREFNDQFSKATERVTSALARMYQEYAKQRDLAAQRWDEAADDTSFPRGDSRDESMIGFARAVYVGDSDNSAQALYQRSTIARATLTEPDYVQFHDARRDLTRFLQQWYERVKGKDGALVYVRKRLDRPSNRRMLKFVAYLEIALAEILRNPDPTVDKQGWYVWVSGWY